MHACVERSDVAYVAVVRREPGSALTARRRDVTRQQPTLPAADIAGRRHAKQTIRSASTCQRGISPADDAQQPTLRRPTRAEYRVYNVQN